MFQSEPLQQVPGCPAAFAHLPHSNGSGSPEVSRKRSAGDASPSGSTGCCRPGGERCSQWPQSTLLVYLASTDVNWFPGVCKKPWAGLAV